MLCECELCQHSEECFPDGNYPTDVSCPQYLPDRKSIKLANRLKLEATVESIKQKLDTAIKTKNKKDINNYSSMLESFGVEVNIDSPNFLQRLFNLTTK